MQHPRDIRRPHPGTHQAKVDAKLNTISVRLDDIVDVVGHLESDVTDLDVCYADVIPRLDNIEAEIRVLQYSAGKMNEWLSRAEHRVNELQEKIDAID